MTFARSYCKSSGEMSSPSISIGPANSSTMRLKLRHIVDLPAPVRPTTPILVLGFTVNVRFFNTAGVVGLYFKVTFVN